MPCGCEIAPAPGPALIRRMDQRGTPCFGPALSLASVRARRYLCAGRANHTTTVMVARIYRPAKPATQSGWAKTRRWILEMEPKSRKEPDPLCGWLGSADTEQQVQLKFPTREAAISYARRRGIEYRLYEPHERIVQPKSYADNFIRRT